MTNQQRLQIISRYDPKTGVLKLIMKNEINRRTRIVYRNLGNSDRTEAEREMYAILGCENIIPHEDLRKLRILGVGDFISYSREQR